MDRHNQNEEKQHCILGHLPTAFVEKGAAPGNYTIRIQAVTPAGSGAWSTQTSFDINEQTISAETSNAVVIGVGCAAAVILLLIAAFLYVSHQRRYLICFVYHLLLGLAFKVWQFEAGPMNLDAFEYKLTGFFNTQFHAKCAVLKKFLRL